MAQGHQRLVLQAVMSITTNTPLQAHRFSVKAQHIHTAFSKTDRMYMNVAAIKAVIRVGLVVAYSRQCEIITNGQVRYCLRELLFRELPVTFSFDCYFWLPHESIVYSGSERSAKQPFQCVGSRERVGRRCWRG